MNFYCDKCSFNWVICSQCTFDMQPKSSLTLRDQNRNRHNVSMYMSNMMCQHTLPHTIQDARKLMEKDSSFVSGLLCPEIYVNQSDG